MPFTIENITAPLTRLPKGEQKTLIEQFTSKEFVGFIDNYISSTLKVAQALVGVAANFAVTPISGKKVGAVALGASGNIYLGANMEFVGVPLSSSLHAEQSAILHAWMHGETAILGLFISESPCGHCRQFLCELPNSQKLPIIAGGAVTKLQHLLPMPFGGPRKKGHSLLDSRSQRLTNVEKVKEPRIRRAINAAARSYTPYTKNPEGVLLECGDGKTFTGRAAESSALNPSISAIACALNQRNFSSSRTYDIKTCTLAKLQNAPGHQETLTTEIMRGIANIEVDTVLMEEKY